MCGRTEGWGSNPRAFPRNFVKVEAAPPVDEDSLEKRFDREKPLEESEELLSFRTSRDTDGALTNGLVDSVNDDTNAPW